MFDSFKIRAAILKQQRGDNAAAKATYEEMYKKGVILSSYILPWAVMLLREGGMENYQKAKEILAKAQKAPDMNPKNRSELLLDYAVANYKLGNIDQAIELLERVHQKTPSGDTYSALGFLYVMQGDAEKALAFNQGALEYDDEDPIVLDNLGQTYYRLLGDKEKALEYFQKAIEIKPSQIDTLWFLSRYDIENGDNAAAIEKLETLIEGRFSPLNCVTKPEVEAEIARLRG